MNMTAETLCPLCGFPEIKSLYCPAPHVVDWQNMPEREISAYCLSVASVSSFICLLADRTTLTSAGRRRRP
jgi:hypothetical protein